MGKLHFWFKRKEYLHLNPLHRWVSKAQSLPFIKIISIDTDIAIESCELPGHFHGDPTDRMIVSTARILNVPLLTRDKKIIEYSKENYLKVIESQPFEITYKNK